MKRIEIDENLCCIYIDGEEVGSFSQFVGNPINFVIEINGEDCYDYAYDIEEMIQKIKQ